MKKTAITLTMLEAILMQTGIIPTAMPDMAQMVINARITGLWVAGKLRLNRAPHSVVKLLEAKAAVFQPQIVASKKHLTMALPEALLPIDFDREGQHILLYPSLCSGKRHVSPNGDAPIRAAAAKRD